MEALQSIGNPVKARYRFRQDFEEYVTVFQKYK